MGTFRVMMAINRPATDVFAFVAEPRNMPRWYDAVERVTEVTPRTATQAASYRITRSLPGGRADNIVEVTESTPNLTVTFESREGPTPYRYRYANPTATEASSPSTQTSRAPDSPDHSPIWTASQPEHSNKECNTTSRD